MEARAISVDRLERACWERVRRRRDTILDLLDLLRPHLAKSLSECDVLDMGCGLGALALPAARWTRTVTGVDSDRDYIGRCRESAAREGLENVTFQVGSILDLGEGEYDIVLCSDVVEHVEDQRGVLRALRRSLGAGGAYYLSTNNRWWPYEGHYGLPLLSYLPKDWADGYVRLMGKGDHCNIHPLSLRDLERLLDEAGLEHSLVPPLHPHTMMYKVGAKLVTAAPVMWHFANAFQVIGRRAR